jgi:hypothetical protein
MMPPILALAVLSIIGLPPLTETDQLGHYAQIHAETMAQAGEVFHSSASFLTTAGGTAEVVGRGATTTSIVEAFMDSPSHRAALTGDFTHMGVGIATRDGVTYMVVILAKHPQKAPTTTTTTTTVPLAAPTPPLRTKPPTYPLI